VGKASQEARRKELMMDEQQLQRVNQAAEQFADAFVQAQRAAAERGVSMQEMNAQLTQDFFNRVIENLRTQAEDTRGLGQQLGDLQQQATEAGRTLTQESVSAYMDFVNSMFSAAQVGGQAAQRGAERTGGGR
jgi:ABC-type transporter Mla subunit MlaD